MIMSCEKAPVMDIKSLVSTIIYIYIAMCCEERCIVMLYISLCKHVTRAIKYVLREQKSVYVQHAIKFCNEADS